MLKTVSARMETMGIHLDASDEAVAELAKEGFDPKYGAQMCIRDRSRPLRVVRAETYSTARSQPRTSRWRG